ncbi:MAG: lyase family protein [Candidatus Saccharimonadaceae bacterium]|nr:lyase family protein [Candidatus Saccharimonadaceae bacterium]
MESYDIYDNLSVLDHRYRHDELAKYLSENAFIKYKLQVEIALMEVLCLRNICQKSDVDEVMAACSRIKAAHVAKEEQVTKHDIRALVNCIRARVTDRVKPFVHMTATSFDVIDSANALRFKDSIKDLLIPRLEELKDVLIDISICEASTIQIGRTHGQHAVPITFGFAISEYVGRLDNSIESLIMLVDKIPGKFSGAVGAYNASSLFFDDPLDFEREVLHHLGLIPPCGPSTQIVPPEALIRCFFEIFLASGVMANLAEDMRNLQRTEISEIAEAFDVNQVGSSTMAQKRNPINFENAKSMWSIIMPRIITMLINQLSDHQRDLTNSASGRTFGEIIAFAVLMSERLTGTMKKLRVDHENMKRNLDITGDLVLAEPLYIILAYLGHPDAHESVRKLTLKARSENKKLMEVVSNDPGMTGYLERMTHRQRLILSDPSLYTGLAFEVAESTAGYRL